MIVCVVAMARNRVIGDGTGLIWHLPGDLKRVKALTMGCPLIMGRRTWESIGRALPGRLSIVLTRNSSWSAPDAVAVQTMEQAIGRSVHHTILDALEGAPTRCASIANDREAVQRYVVEHI